MVKVGISNAKSLKNRLKKHAGQGLTVVLWSDYFADGAIPPELESKWRNYVKHLPADLRPTREQLPDGYTEAVLDHAGLWQALEAIRMHRWRVNLS